MTSRCAQRRPGRPNPRGVSDAVGVLARCSIGWHESRNEIVAWWNYFLGILRNAYGEFGHQVDSARAHPAKSELVRRVVLAQTEPFTLADLSAQLPSVSPQPIKKVLAGLREAGRVRLEGRGRGAQWSLVRRS